MKCALSAHGDGDPICPGLEQYLSFSCCCCFALLFLDIKTVPSNKWICLQSEHSPSVIFDSSYAASTVPFSGFTRVEFVSSWYNWWSLLSPVVSGDNTWYNCWQVGDPACQREAVSSHMLTASRWLPWFGVRREHVLRRDVFLQFLLFCHREKCFAVQIKRC